MVESMVWQKERSVEPKGPKFNPHPWNLLFSGCGVNHSPLGVIPLSCPPTWVEAFWVIPMTGGSYWQLVGEDMDVKCLAKDRRVQFKELSHPKNGQRLPLSILLPSVSLVVRGCYPFRLSVWLKWDGASKSTQPSIKCQSVPDKSYSPIPLFLLKLQTLHGVHHTDPSCMTQQRNSSNHFLKAVKNKVAGIPTNFTF